MYLFIFKIYEDTFNNINFNRKRCNPIKWNTIQTNKFESYKLNIYIIITDSIINIQ